ncbi:MAG: hypothetical protein E7178_01825 [Erysipelotrichaceae bacterium]|nr:hypothetical protein [Erysipelotrichaceae bacterium]
MNGKYKKLTLNTILFAIGGLGSKVLIFLLVPLYTNAMTTDQYGIADLVITLSALLMPVITLSLSEAVLYFGISKGEDKNKILLNSFLVVIIGSLVLLSSFPLLRFYQPISDYVFYLIGFTIVTSFRNIMQFHTKSLEKNVLFSIDSILQTSILVLSNILFLLVFKMGIEGYLLSLIIAESVSLLFLFIGNRALSSLLSAKIDWQLLKRMLLFSIPLIFNNISWWIIHSTDKIMIQFLISDDAVGIYAVATKIPTLITTVTNIFCQAWIISTYVEYSKKDTHFYETVFDFYSFLLNVGIAVLLLILKPFMSIYVGANFFESWQFVPLLLLAAIFQSYTSFFGAIIQSANKNNKLMIVTIVGMVFNVGLNFALIPFLGIQGAIIATLVSNFVISLLRMILSKKCVEYKINYFKFILSFGVLLGESLALIYDFHPLIITICSVVAILIIHYKNIIFIIKWLMNRKKKGEAPAE